MPISLEEVLNEIERKYDLLREEISGLMEKGKRPEDIKKAIDQHPDIIDKTLAKEMVDEIRNKKII